MCATPAGCGENCNYNGEPGLNLGAHYDPWHPVKYDTIMG